MAFLVGPDGKTFELPNHPCRCGSAPGNELVIPSDFGVAPLHCTIWADMLGHIVEDNLSSLSTLINDSPVKMTRLSDRDVLCIGGFTCQYFVGVTSLAEPGKTQAIPVNPTPALGNTGRTVVQASVAGTRAPKQQANMRHLFFGRKGPGEKDEGDPDNQIPASAPPPARTTPTEGAPEIPIPASPSLASPAATTTARSTAPVKNDLSPFLQRLTPAESAGATKKVTAKPFARSPFAARIRSKPAPAKARAQTPAPSQPASSPRLDDRPPEVFQRPVVTPAISKLEAETRPQGTPLRELSNDARSANPFAANQAPRGWQTLPHEPPPQETTFLANPAFAPDANPSPVPTPSPFTTAASSRSGATEPTPTAASSPAPSPTTPAETPLPRSPEVRSPRKPMAKKRPGFWGRIFSKKPSRSKGGSAPKAQAKARPKDAKSAKAKTKATEPPRAKTRPTREPWSKRLAALLPSRRKRSRVAAKTPRRQPPPAPLEANPFASLSASPAKPTSAPKAAPEPTTKTPAPVEPPSPFAVTAGPPALPAQPSPFAVTPASSAPPAASAAILTETPSASWEPSFAMETPPAAVDAPPGNHRALPPSTEEKPASEPAPRPARVSPPRRKKKPSRSPELKRRLGQAACAVAQAVKNASSRLGKAAQDRKLRKVRAAKAAPQTKPETSGEAESVEPKKPRKASWLERRRDARRQSAASRRARTRRPKNSARPFTETFVGGENGDSPATETPRPMPRAMTPAAAARAAGVPLTADDLTRRIVLSQRRSRGGVPVVRRWFRSWWAPAGILLIAAIGVGYAIWTKHPVVRMVHSKLTFPTWKKPPPPVAFDRGANYVGAIMREDPAVVLHVNTGKLLGLFKERGDLDDIPHLGPLERFLREHIAMSLRETETITMAGISPTEFAVVWRTNAVMDADRVFTTATHYQPMQLRKVGAFNAVFANPDGASIGWLCPDWQTVALADEKTLPELQEMANSLDAWADEAKPFFRESDLLAFSLRRAGIPEPTGRLSALASLLPNLPAQVAIKLSLDKELVVEVHSTTTNPEELKNWLGGVPTALGLKEDPRLSGPVESLFQSLSFHGEPTGVRARASLKINAFTDWLFQLQSHVAKQLPRPVEPETPTVAPRVSKEDLDLAQAKAQSNARTLARLFILAKGSGAATGHIKSVPEAIQLLQAGVWGAGKHSGSFFQSEPLSPVAIENASKHLAWRGGSLVYTGGP